MNNELDIYVIILSVSTVAFMSILIIIGDALSFPPCTLSKE